MEPEEENVDMDLAFERVSKVFGLAALRRADKTYPCLLYTSRCV